MKLLPSIRRKNPEHQAVYWLGPAFAAVAFAAIPLRAADCLQWIKRNDVGSYGQRYLHAMAYDSDRGVTVFFGGEIGGDPPTYFDDTQEYDGKQWKQIVTAVKPPKRSGHAMAYDPVRKQVVLFGGSVTVPASGFDADVLYNDTWTYTSDGINGFWVRQQDTNAPARVGHQMIWDSGTGTILVHGGRTRDATQDLGTWFWGGTFWSALVGGPSLTDFGMVFDSERRIGLIVGGFIRADESNRSADRWEQERGGAWVNRGAGPSARAQLAAAYDERRHRTVIVGGVGESIETGETAYEFVPGTGWIRLPSLPSGQGRAGARMIYDRKRGVMVLTGGAGGGAPNASQGGRYSDTWELWPSLFISSHPANVTNVVCGTATFSVLPLGAEPFQYQWRLDGAPLTNGAHFSGTTTAELRISQVQHTHAGKYDVIVQDQCNPPNVVTSKVATLSLQPDLEWVRRATNGPPARFGHSLVYDDSRHVTVLFGGRTNGNSIGTLNDLWEWDGARWSLRMPNSGTNGWTNVPGRGWQPSYRDRPVQRAHHAMAYDQKRGRVVLFGGIGSDPSGVTPPLNDLWEWDGAQWHFRATNGPTTRVYGSMAYDERRRRTVLFGGQSYGPGNPDTELVWEWDGDRWHTNAPATGPSGPNARTQGRMAYDSFRGVTVFGPTSESYSLWSFWDWDGVKWTNFPVLHFSDPIVTALHGTVSGGFAFDMNRRRSVWFGGAQGGPVNHSAFYDGRNWTLLPNGTAPAKRTLTALAYDSARRVTVLFGGSLTASGSFAATNDTWELAAVDVPVIHEQPMTQIGAAGQTTTFRVHATGRGRLSYQWFFEGSAMAGANGETLTIASVNTNDAGAYHVVVSSDCGTVTSRIAHLSLLQELQLLYSTGIPTLLWPAEANTILETAEHVTGPWTTLQDPPNPFVLNPTHQARFYRTRHAP